MQKNTNRWRRLLVRLAIAIGVFFALIMLVISPLAKYLVEKYDYKILGRRIEIGGMYVNPVTGYVRITNLRVYEPGDSILFFTAEKVCADFSMLKLLNKTYEIHSITVTRPRGRIVQTRKHISFQDIIDHYRKKDKTINKDEPTHFNILNCTVEDGEFYYLETTIPVTYFIKHVNITSPGKWWNVDTMIFKGALQSGPYSGTIRGDMSINFKNSNYFVNADIDSFDLKPLSQYMRELSNYGDFGGWVNASGGGEGNFKNRLAFKMHGLVFIDRFQFGPSVYEDYGSFQRLVLDIHEANPGAKRYRIDSVMLDRPYFRYEKYDSLDNLSRMFGIRGTKPGIHSQSAEFNLILKIAEYLVDLAKNFARSDYVVNKFTINKADFVFNDYSLREKFGVDAMPLYLYADTISKHRERVEINLKAGIRPYGDVNIDVSINPVNYGDFDIHYKVHKVPVSVFNPYLITYTSFPLDRGTLELNGLWNVKDSVIKSVNHVIVMDPRVGKKMKRNDTKWIPLPLIMSIVREPGAVLDYEVPVGGNLKSPKFDLHDVIKDVVKNIFIKPPATPYLLHVKKLEATVEKMIYMKWEMRQTMPYPQQQKFINTIAEFLHKNPGNIITVAPLVYDTKEKEHIAYFEMKKRYYLKGKNNPFTEEDSLEVEMMSVKDEGFIKYLDKLTRDTMLFSTWQKCSYLLGEDYIDAKLTELNSRRQQTFLSAFRANNSAGQVKFAAPQKDIPFNGYSRYKIDYNGEVPEKLSKAYQEMDELNAQAPRKKYNQERWLPKVKGLKKNH